MVTEGLAVTFGRRRHSDNGKPLHLFSTKGEVEKGAGGGKVEETVNNVAYRGEIGDPSEVGGEGLAGAVARSEVGNGNIPLKVGSPRVRY